jgi:glucose-1-phosphate thymidylyltransferase
MKFHGIIPAAGTGSRLGKLPVSKEIYPIIRDARTAVLCENLIRYYRLAEIRNIHFIIRKGKWDILDYLGDGGSYGVNLSYLIAGVPHGTPFTVDQAYSYVRDDYVAMGFPDIVNSPEDLFVQMKERIIRNRSDVVLGLCPIKQYKVWDMIDFEGGRIKDILIKQDCPHLKYGWANAVWGPKFTEFSHQHLQLMLANNEPLHALPDGTRRELCMGDLMLAALKSGLWVDYVIFEHGTSVDLGTLDNLSNYLAQFNGQP